MRKPFDGIFPVTQKFGEKITDPAESFPRAQLAEGLVLRRGKKNFNKVIVG